MYICLSGSLLGYVRLAKWFTPTHMCIQDVGSLPKYVHPGGWFTQRLCASRSLVHSMQMCIQEVCSLSAKWRIFFCHGSIIRGGHRCH